MDVKACPFCAGYAFTDVSEDGVFWSVKCAQCGARTDEFRSKEAAIAYWNSREGLVLMTSDESYPFTEQQWEELKARWASAPRQWFAETRWAVEDVLAAAEEQDIPMTEDQARAWWQRNESRFQNMLVEYGNELLAAMDFDE